MSLDIVLAIWALLGLFAVVWASATTAAGPRLPHAADVIGFFLRSWAGRCLVLASWGYIGWHLFCQRP